MIKLTKERILLLHQIMTEATGGGSGLRDEALLESAVESCFATFDGNKRIGIYAMLTFLEINGVKIKADNNDIVRVGMSVADGSMSYEDLKKWILTRRA